MQNDKLPNTQSSMNTRDSNIELLRGVLMFMIVCVHITGNGVLNADNPIDVFNLNWVWANIIDGAFYCCVNTFVLITGYYGLRPSIKKWISLDFPVILYCVTFTLLIGGASVRNIIGAAMPTMSDKYWFLTQYFLLYLSSPFLNSFIENHSRRQMILAISIGCLCIILFPTFLGLSIAESRGMDFVNFALIYLIGRYIGIYKIELNRTKSAIIYLMTTILIIGLTLFLGFRFNINRGWQSHFFAYNNALVYVQAISFFYLFKSFRLTSKMINWLSPSFFYIYIIHETPAIKSYLYEWIGCTQYYESPYFIVHTLLSALAIFLTCIVIDVVLRRILLKKPIVWCQNKIEMIISYAQRNLNK